MRHSGLGSDVGNTKEKPPTTMEVVQFQGDKPPTHDTRNVIFKDLLDCLQKAESTRKLDLGKFSKKLRTATKFQAYDSEKTRSGIKLKFAPRSRTPGLLAQELLDQECVSAACELACICPPLRRYEPLNLVFEHIGPSGYALLSPQDQDVLHAATGCGVALFKAGSIDALLQLIAQFPDEIQADIARAALCRPLLSPERSAAVLAGLKPSVWERVIIQAVESAANSRSAPDEQLRQYLPLVETLQQKRTPPQLICGAIAVALDDALQQASCALQANWLLPPALTNRFDSCESLSPDGSICGPESDSRT